MNQAPKARMTGAQRREQLIRVGRGVFAERGVTNATVEEVAAAAGVTKPVVYEHFGGKEGLYAVVVDRELTTLLTLMTRALGPDLEGRPLMSRAALALLTYVEDRPDGFRVLSRDSPTWHGSDRLGSLLSEIGDRVADILSPEFDRVGIDPRFAPLYAQMLIGTVAYTGEWWLEHGPDIGKEEVAAHMTNFVWKGLAHLDTHPELRLETEDTQLRP